MDPYLQADGRTLVNRLGIQFDPVALTHRETALAEFRSAQLAVQGMPKVTGFERVKAIHRHLFQDVYDWAGVPRSVSLARARHVDGGAVSSFTPPALIEAQGRQLFQGLFDEDHLCGLTPGRFARRLAVYFAELNRIHPFRDGNGRTQRLVWVHVAGQAGHALDFFGISRERMTTVSIAAMDGDLAPGERMFRELLHPERVRALRTAVRFLDANRSKNLDWRDRHVSTTEAGQHYRGTFVGTNGQDMMMHDGRAILIGQVRDVAAQRDRLRPGDDIAFTASRWPGGDDLQPDPDPADSR